MIFECSCVSSQCPAYDGVEFTFYYADPEHCQQYWQCLYGCASQKVCPDGYLFDDFQEMCMPAGDVRRWKINTKLW